MENEEIYGKTCYKLTFSQAADDGIICNYKVIISVTTNEDVNREALTRGDVEIGDDFVRAKQIANQLSIKECLEKYGVKKIFTFHKSIASAKSFTKDDVEGISQQIPYLKTYHVNGKIKAGQRENIINEFRESDFALMSNSRCLTEGVDVPAVDLVAFMSPKRSQVDVIQATGRAMRKSEGKSIGYVLVPIYLQSEDGETLADAVNASDFNEVFDVLNALQEQDENLYSSLCNLKVKTRKTKGYTDDYFNKIIDINGPEIDLKEMKDAITTRVVNKLAPDWYEKYGELKEYYEKNGHIDIPKNKKNKQLINWVMYQRQQYRIGILPEDRINMLEKFNFIWDMSQVKWDEKFYQLKTYYEKHGTTLMPARTPKIGTWCVFQRQKYFKDELNSDQIKRLDSIKFVWAPREDNWEERYLELLEF